MPHSDPSTAASAVQYARPAKRQRRRSAKRPWRRAAARRRNQHGQQEYPQRSECDQRIFQMVQQASILVHSRGFAGNRKPARGTVCHTARYMPVPKGASAAGFELRMDQKATPHWP